MDPVAWIYKLVFILRSRIRLFVFGPLVKLKLRILGVKLGRGTMFNGAPVIHRAPGSEIIIGDNCLFNSARHSVEIRLQKCCTFLTLRKGAVISFGKGSGASGCTFAASDSIRVGENVLIGAHTTIIDNDFHGSDPLNRKKYASAPVVIEDNVFIGFNCFILKGVTIGRNSLIGANSVVTGNIPPDSIAIGNPCKLVIKRSVPVSPLAEPVNPTEIIIK